MFTLPDFPSPVAGGWITSPWNFSRASHPTAQSSVTHAGSGDRRRALTRNYPVIHPSIRLVHSKGATSLSHRQIRLLDHGQWCRARFQHVRLP